MKTLFTLFICLCLTGCASMNADFECKMKPGVKCTGLDDINKMVDQGKLGNKRTVNEKADANAFGNFSTPFPMTIKAGEPLRYGEQVIQVWIAPYEDTGDYYHQQSYLNVIAKTGHWIGDPVSAKEIE